MEKEPAAVLEFWLAYDDAAYFTIDSSFDAEVARRFGPLLEAAKSGRLDGWAKTPEGTLALVILLDQMGRNIHRRTAEMYAGDAKALSLAKEAVRRGFDEAVGKRERRWLYMPFMHSEDLADQETCVALCRKAELDDTLPHAVEHAEIIRRFGRFPHRNAILGRPSTPEEQAFLAGGGFSG